MNNVDNTKELQLLSFCTGYGGIERGLELAGVKFRTIAHVEIETFAIANLVAKMEAEQMVPAPVWTNVKTLPLEVFRDRVDILTGGYPCQPFSVAGKQLGKEDPRHLFPYILRAIGVIRPRVVFFENVEGHINNGLQEVIGDLEKRGYRATWGIFSASEVGAPHQRKRVFIMGYSEHNGSRTESQLRCDEEASDNGREKESGKTVESERADRPIDESSMSGCKEGSELGYSNSEGSQGSKRKGSARTKRKPQGHSSKCNIKSRFPSRHGEQQYEWEEPRTVKPCMGRTANGVASRVDELRLLGNGVVPQTAALAWKTLSDRLK